MAQRPRALVVRSAGTNCDAETAFVLEQCGATATIVPAEPFLARPAQLADYQLLAIPGGFSYGDDILAGKVFGLELATHAGEEIVKLVQRGGAAIGICNGFQILVQMGLLPGMAKPFGAPEVTLTDNDVHKYQDRWVRMRVTSDRCAWLRKGETLAAPAAHGEGKLVPRDATVRRRLHDEGHVVLRYVGPDGADDPPFPWCPNGAIDAIAGLTDRTGRILGLMPHPERHYFPWQHPTWTRDGLAEVTDGRRLFERGVQAVVTAG
ncbi:MAG: phosphoribosylformylglycinamidine synthase I [Planctomycetes bacterium]|nr:phosphoribosylformylglycinamidine synthase I [Planctomycetota bacterium]